MTWAAGEVSAGSLGLLIIVALFVVTVLLIRNMAGRIKRLPESFDDSPVSPEDGDAASSGPTSGA
jgi:hypothetical protein